MRRYRNGMSWTRRFVLSVPGSGYIYARPKRKMSINANSLSITDALVDFLRESGLEQTVMDRQIEEVWPQVMGETVQKLTRSVEVKDGMLYVRVNSAALKTQLFENRFELVRKLNEAVGAPAIRDCRILG